MRHTTLYTCEANKDNTLSDALGVVKLPQHKKKKLGRSDYVTRPSSWEKPVLNMLCCKQRI
jgi:hypothetical protein